MIVSHDEHLITAVGLPPPLTFPNTHTLSLCPTRKYRNSVWHLSIKWGSLLTKTKRNHDDPHRYATSCGSYVTSASSSPKGTSRSTPKPSAMQLGRATRIRLLPPATRQMLYNVFCHGRSRLLSEHSAGLCPRPLNQQQFNVLCCGVKQHRTSSRHLVWARTSCFDCLLCFVSHGWGRGSEHSLQPSMHFGYKQDGHSDIRYPAAESDCMRAQILRRSRHTHLLDCRVDLAAFLAFSSSGAISRQRSSYECLRFSWYSTYVGVREGAGVYAYTQGPTRMALLLCGVQGHNTQTSPLHSLKLNTTYRHMQHNAHNTTHIM